MKKTREVTIIHYRRRRVKKSRAGAAECCPGCESGSELITMAAAARLTGLSRSTLNGWIASHEVHTTRSVTGQLHICFKSLIDSLSQWMGGEAVRPGGFHRSETRRPVRFDRRLKKDKKEKI